MEQLVDRSHLLAAAYAVQAAFRRSVYGAAVPVLRGAAVSATGISAYADCSGRCYLSAHLQSADAGAGYAGEQAACAYPVRRVAAGFLRIAFSLYPAVPQSDIQRSALHYTLERAHQRPVGASPAADRAQTQGAGLHREEYRIRVRHGRAAQANYPAGQELHRIGTTICSAARIHAFPQPRYPCEAAGYAVLHDILVESRSVPATKGLGANLGDQVRPVRCADAGRAGTRRLSADDTFLDEADRAQVPLAVYGNRAVPNGRTSRDQGAVRHGYDLLGTAASPHRQRHAYRRIRPAADRVLRGAAAAEIRCTKQRKKWSDRV